MGCCKSSAVRWKSELKVGLGVDMWTPLQGAVCPVLS